MDWEINCAIRHCPGGSRINSMGVAKISFHFVRDLGVRLARRVFRPVLYQSTRYGLR